MKKRSLTAAALMTTAVVAVGTVAPAAASAATVKAPNAQDVQYLKVSATMDLEEIAGGAVAYKKGDYPATRAYGKRLATDHIKHYAQVAILAEAYGITLPRTVPADAVAMLKAVASKSGPAFDLAYLKMEVTGHFDAVALGTQEIEHGSNVRIVNNAEQTSPILRYHLWRGQLDLHYDLWDQGRR
jgi:putative membrane protein